jgi:hypothetical protein
LYLEEHIEPRCCRKYEEHHIANEDQNGRNKEDRVCVKWFSERVCHQERTASHQVLEVGQQEKYGIFIRYDSLSLYSPAAYVPRWFVERLLLHVHKEVDLER